MASVTAVPAEAGFPLIGLPKISCHPLCPLWYFFACDAIAIMFTGSAILVGGHPNGGSSTFIAISLYGRLLECSAPSFATNLYPGVIYNAVNELRSLALALTLSFVALAGVILIGRTADGYPGRLLWWMAAMTRHPSVAIRRAGANLP